MKIESRSDQPIVAFFYSVNVILGKIIKNLNKIILIIDIRILFDILDM